jgi:pimeloyl-ACP methyl ester carboxylesterase
MTGQLPEPSSRFYFSQRLRLHFVEWGNPSAAPMILLHGVRDHCRTWDWVAAALRSDWHVISPDLRGHGDSQWNADGSYSYAGFIYDLAQLVDQYRLAPVTLIGHSLGGDIALRYAGVFPNHVKKLVAVESLGLSQFSSMEAQPKTIVERMKLWIAEQHELSARLPRRFSTIEEAVDRMRQQHPRLTPEQTWHITQHGVNQNEDGTFSWKFDQYVRWRAPYEMAADDIRTLWSAIVCPTLLIHGGQSQLVSPEIDSTIKYFATAQLAYFDEASHWVHHDRLDQFLQLARAFLAEEGELAPTYG